MAKLLELSSTEPPSDLPVFLDKLKPDESKTNDSAEISECFQLPIFLLGQFNVHYLSWIKNSAHLPQYWQRFSPFFESLYQLPEFAGLPSDTLSEPAKWVICQAIQDATEYRRKLTIQLRKVSGVRYYVTNKKFAVFLVDNGQIKANEGENAIGLSRDPKNRIIMGELDLKEDAKMSCVLPLPSNQLPSDLQIHLVLVNSEDNEDDDDSPPHEYKQIVTSEADISGYKGNVKTEAFDVKQGESSLLPIQIELHLKWHVDFHCFEGLVADPVALLRKLPGAMFHLGAYYWHFSRDFYRWAATESLDPDTRYVAMEIFHELSMCLPSQAHDDDLAPIFVDMYCGRYPSADILTVLSSEEDYVCEAISLLDNFIFVFQYLSCAEQLAFLGRLQPFLVLLLQTRFNFTLRLLALIALELGNYESEAIEEIILPICTEAMYFLATICEPEEELTDPRTSKLNWQSVQSMASLLMRLVVECVQQVKPIDWQVLLLENDKMACVQRCVSQLMRSLFNRTSIRFLQSIYLAFVNHEVLTQQQLGSFLTKERLELANQWCDPED